MLRSGAPTAATSQYFVAHLGEATPEVEARLVQWGACCVEHRLVRDGKKCLLYFARAESRSVRQMQSLLRTLSARWKLPLGKLESGWCQLLTETEFRDCVPATEPHADDAMPCGLAEESSGNFSVPCVDPRCGMLLRLPEGFDKRSHQLLGTLRAQRAC